MNNLEVTAYESLQQARENDRKDGIDVSIQYAPTVEGAHLAMIHYLSRNRRLNGVWGTVQQDDGDFKFFELGTNEVFGAIVGQFIHDDTEMDYRYWYRID